ncbi:MAG: DUF4131 domain-containing protein, partial [Burkholderiales bacterium]
MTGGILAFAAGVLLLQQQPTLPALAWLWAIPPLLGLLIWRPLRWPAALALGFLWAAGFAHLRIADRLAPELEGRDLSVVGVVAGLPVRIEGGTSFELDVEHGAGGAQLPRRLRLSWRPALADEAPLLH